MATAKVNNEGQKEENVLGPKSSYRPREIHLIHERVSILFKDDVVICHCSVCDKALGHNPAKMFIRHRAEGLDIKVLCDKTECSVKLGKVLTKEGLQ